MIGVGSAICILEAPAPARTIVVGSIDSGPNREGQLARAGLEDPLHADEGNANALEVETSMEHRPGKDVVVPGYLLGQPVECSTADRRVTHELIL